MGVRGGKGFAGLHGKVKALGYKGIKMGISFLKEAQFIRMAGMGSGLQVHTGSVERAGVRDHTPLPVGDLLRTQIS